MSSSVKPMEVQEDQPGTRVEQFGNQILRVRGDGHSDLEALFSVLENRADANAPSSVGSSFKNRKLPASFFRPPEPKHQHHPACLPAPPGGHDCSAAEGPIHHHHHRHPGTVSTSAMPIHSPVISHCRSRSSPVKHSGAAPPPPRHARQSSVDGSCKDEFLLPHQAASWDVLAKCPKCQMKCWSQDLHTSGYVPVADVAQQHQMLNHQQQQQQQPHGICPNQPPHQSVDLSKHQDLGPLPPGWEQGITPEGELYFINHIDQTTSWNDPRLLCGAHSMGSVAMCQALHPLEQQVPQFSQQPGYLSQQQQQQQQLLQQQQGGGLSVPSARRPLANDQFLCLQLRQLQQEKERLLQEQEAIACKEMMLNELVRHSAASGSGDGQLKCMSASCALNPGQGIQPSSSSSSSSCNPALDPFLGQSGHGPVESHVRQSSTDSGLGGMGATYSLPRSPDDYLSNVEETEGNYKVPMSHNACRGNGNTGGDMTSVSEMADFLEGEHLITSLGEELENELFNEMDVQKINNLLWLRE